MSSSFKEQLAGLAPKLENIISGHRINQDDADWLRGLLHRATLPEPGVVSEEAVEAALNGFFQEGPVTPRTEYAKESMRCALSDAMPYLAPAAPAGEAQPVAWQYQDRDGKWHGFTDESHRLNTIEESSWPVRALYAHPPPSSSVGVEGWRVDPVEGDPDMLAVETPDGRTWFAKRGDRVFELAEALALARQPAPVGVPVDVVREYLDARACYEAATRPPNSHARAPVLKHGDPDALRLREARVALDNAIALAQQPAAEPRSTHRVWRRNDWLPCYCEATSDHHIGCEQPAAVDDLNAWRAAFIAERAMRYREGGMAIEQARIHAETDAGLMEMAAIQQQGGEK